MNKKKPKEMLVQLEKVKGTVNFLCGRGNEMGPSHALFLSKGC